MRYADQRDRAARRVLIFVFLFPRQYGNAGFRYSDEQARSTRRFTNSRSTSIRSIPTSKAGSSWQTFTRRVTSTFPFLLTLAWTIDTDKLDRYEYSLQSLMHVLLLAPQNPFYILQVAETAYTAGDLPFSIKMFLTVVDMTDSDDSESLVESTPLGITVRAWYGVKLVSTFGMLFRIEKATVTLCSVRDASRRTHGLRRTLPPIRPFRKMSRCLMSLRQSVYGSHTRVLVKRVRLQKGETRCLLGLLFLDSIFACLTCLSTIAWLLVLAGHRGVVIEVHYVDGSV